MSRDFDVFAPPDWSWAQEDGTFGNRFDDPGKYRGIPEEARFRVIYCATRRVGAFGETIARFRRSPRLAEGLEAIDDEGPLEAELEGGELPEEWRLGRRLGSTICATSSSTPSIAPCASGGLKRPTALVATDAP